MKLEESKAQKIAEEHTEWFIRTIRMIYKDAFIHGFKHGEKANE